MTTTPDIKYFDRHQYESEVHDLVLELASITPDSETAHRLHALALQLHAANAALRAFETGRKKQELTTLNSHLPVGPFTPAEWDERVARNDRPQALQELLGQFVAFLHSTADDDHQRATQRAEAAEELSTKARDPYFRRDAYRSYLHNDAARH